MNEFSVMNVILFVQFIDLYSFRFYVTTDLTGEGDKRGNDI